MNAGALACYRLASMGACIVCGFFIVSIVRSLTPRTDGPQMQRITCVNNLKQIGLAFKLWALDHGDRFRFDVSTNEGGTREFSAVGPDGYDRNAFLHFQVMSNELSDPRVLVCPRDSKTRPAANFRELAAKNVTYRLRTGTNITEATPNQELARCPIDGNVLRCDMTVDMTVTQVNAEREGSPKFIELLKLDQRFRWKVIAAGVFAIAGFWLRLRARLPQRTCRSRVEAVNGPDVCC